MTLVDSTYILRIMYELNVIPLALQITNICGNVMVCISGDKCGCIVGGLLEFPHLYNFVIALNNKLFITNPSPS